MMSEASKAATMLPDSTQSERSDKAVTKRKKMDETRGKKKKLKNAKLKKGRVKSLSIVPKLMYFVKVNNLNKKISFKSNIPSY